MGLLARTPAWVVLSGVVVAGVSGCTDEPGREKAVRPPASTSASPSTPVEPRGDDTARACPTTDPTPASIPGHPADVLFGSDLSSGNGELWVGGLGGGGVIRADRHFVARDGSVLWKLGWWRQVPGDLEISGERLDAPAAPLRAVVPSGYGTTGFQSSGVAFPTEGCWRVTGRVGSSALTFVVSVVKT
jgi:hypothetical protein